MYTEQSWGPQRREHNDKEKNLVLNTTAVPNPYPTKPIITNPELALYSHIIRKPPSITKGFSHPSYVYTRAVLNTAILGNIHHDLAKVAIPVHICNSHHAPPSWSKGKIKPLLSVIQGLLHGTSSDYSYD